MKIADQGSPSREPGRRNETMTNHNRENHLKYFSQETLDKYVDDYDKNCDVVPCWVCLDTKTKVARENLGLGPVIGFSK